MMRILLITLLSVLTFVSCKKDKPTQEDTPTLSTVPEAVAAHDTKSGGVYKGVIVGSSGTIKLDLQSASSTAVVTFDGVTKTLTTNSLNNWSSGQAISNAVFSSGSWTLTFSVDANGQNPIISASIPNHTVSAAVVKETSANLVRSFEGTYSGSVGSGTWNFIVRGNSVKGIRKSIGDNSKVPLSGTLDGNTITGQGYTGTINGNTASGTWTDNTDTHQAHGTWTGKRTL